MSLLSLPKNSNYPLVKIMLDHPTKQLEWMLDDTHSTLEIPDELADGELSAVFVAPDGVHLSETMILRERTVHEVELEVEPEPVKPRVETPVVEPAVRQLLDAAVHVTDVAADEKPADVKPVGEAAVEQAPVTKAAVEVTPAVRK